MCFSRFIFFLLMIYFLLFILYLFWTMEMILDKSIVEWFSYLSLKRVIKQQKQLSTLTMHLAQELLRNVQCSGGSRSSAKRTRALKIRIAVDSHDNNRLRPIIETDALTTIREAAKENVDHLTLIQHLKQTGKVTKLTKWVPHELTKN